MKQHLKRKKPIENIKQENNIYVLSTIQILKHIKPSTPSYFDKSSPKLFSL